MAADTPKTTPKTKKTTSKSTTSKVEDPSTLPVSEDIVVTEEEITEEIIEMPEESSNHTEMKTKQAKKSRNTFQKILLGIIIVVALCLGIAAGVLVFLAYRNVENDHKAEKVDFPDPIYSVLTGEEIDNADLNSKPTFCVQIPNGGDGARPQAGLGQAAVVFEAIAESGITRFAAVFQNPTVSAIGPIRSLRPYYLSWDLPFDCTVVHAGGSKEALSSLAASGQHDLDENLTYMWRENNTTRGWNNLFTSSADLEQYSINSGKQTSQIKSFPRLTTDEATDAASKVHCDTDDTEGDEANCTTELVGKIEIDFGMTAAYNTVYNYDSESNTYYRSYATGENHVTYDCPTGIDEPNTITACGQPVQVAPSVVIAMHVYEQRMADGYHEDITTRGTGDATIFQNGTAIQGSWFKASDREQIIFRNQDGNEIKLTPGQVWIAAVPQYGDVRY